MELGLAAAQEDLSELTLRQFDVWDTSGPQLKGDDTPAQVRVEFAVDWLTLGLCEDGLDDDVEFIFIHLEVSSRCSIKAFVVHDNPIANEQLAKLLELSGIVILSDLVEAETHLSKVGSLLVKKLLSLLSLLEEGSLVLIGWSSLESILWSVAWVVWLVGSWIGRLVSVSTSLELVVAMLGWKWAVLTWSS